MPEEPLKQMRPSFSSASVHSFEWWLATGVVACACILYVLAWNMYPVPDGDAMYFLPAIRSYALNGIVENRPVNLSFETDPDGLGRYLFYPPMFMVIVGGAARCLGITGYPGIIMVLATVRVASVAIFAFAIHRITLRRYDTTIPPEVTILAFLMIMSNGLFILASNGRPELLTIFLASIAVLLVAVEFGWKDIIHPLLVGLTFSFSIAGGVIAFAFYAVYLCFAQRSCNRRFLLTTAAGVLMIVLFLAGYPVAGIDMGDGINGISLHSKIQLARGDAWSFALLYEFWRSWFLFFVLASIVVAESFSRRTVGLPGLCSWIQSVAAMLLLFVSLLFFGVRIGPSHYNVYAFLPIYQALAFWGFLTYHSHRDPVAGMGRGKTVFDWAWPHPRSVRGAFFVILVVAAWLACRNTTMQLLPFPYYLSSGYDYRSMKGVFAHVLAENPGPYFYTGGLVMLDDSLEGSVFWIDEHDRCTSRRAKHDGVDTQRSIVFVQERNTYQVPPRLPPHLHKIVTDAKDKGPAPLPIRGLRILRSRQGYGFTAFEQEPEEVIQATRP